MQLRQNTSATVRIGPILDSAGAAVTSAVVGDLRITKNGAVAVLSGITITHDHNGNYLVPLTSTHTDTVGRIDISVGNNAMQMVPERFMVLQPSLYDDLVVTSPSDAGGLRDVARIAGQTVNASTAVTFPGSIASQPSVDAIPTNPLLTTDTRLNNLDFPISSINTAIGNLNNLSALINLYGAPLLEIPDAGNVIYAFTIIVRDNEGKLVNLDASPTLAAANASGTSRTSNLSSVTNPATGRYTFTYTVASTHPKESIRITASGTVSGEARYIEWVGNIVDYDTLTTLQQVQTTVNSINTRLPSSPAASGDIPAATTIRDVIMNSMPNGGWVDGSFGDRWLISANNTRELAITGSGHIAAVLHDAEPNSIPDDAFTTAAITRIQNGLALQSTLLIVDKATRLIPALL